ncbi:pseudouridine synthase [Spirochaetia bacterium]|nr:pseudouridine synthase [Spirochaetia bacterium]
MELTTGENDAGRRLDRILRKALQDHPLSLIHRLLRQNRVLVDGAPALPSHRVSAGSLITIKLPTNNSPLPTTAPQTPHQKLPIIWQGADLLILNKPAGLAVHGPDSLDTQVQAYLADQLPPSLSFRPGPLHRLDKPTSGLIVFSASLAGARYFSSLLRNHHVKKYYLALVEGHVEKSEVWQDDLIRDKNLQKTFIAAGSGNNAATEAAGSTKPKAALTSISPLAAAGGYSLILAEIASGRTHQIRAQAASHGHPLAGDTKYGGRPLNPAGRRGSFLLHAWKLEFAELRETATCPALPRSIIAPLPEAFQSRIESTFGSVCTIIRHDTGKAHGLFP